MFTAAALHHDVTLTLPSLPVALAGLRIVHISDLHCARLTSRHDQLIDELNKLGTIDLAFFTGDYMNHPGDEPVAEQLVLRLLETLRPRLGTFGIFGNHDSIAMRERLDDAPIRWLSNESVGLQVGDAMIEVMGFAGDRFTRPDAAALLVHRSNLPSTDHRPPRPMLRLLLSHYPTYLPTAADLGVDVMFSGHTHGGQLRLPFYGALYNSSDLPLALSSGLLRCRNTLAAVSRGLGETFLPIRWFCPPQLPVYEFHPGPLPGPDSWTIRNIQPW